MNFVVIFGPPAVGKMTVGQELARLTGYKLFHNHVTIDLVSEYFEFGTPPFSRLVREFRARIIQEAAASEMACCLSDVMERRTGLATSRFGGPDTADRVCRIMTPIMGWSASQAQGSLDAYIAQWKSRLDWT